MFISSLSLELEDTEENRRKIEEILHKAGIRRLKEQKKYYINIIFTSRSSLMYNPNTEKIIPESCEKTPKFGMITSHGNYTGEVFGKIRNAIWMAFGIDVDRTVM